MSCAVDASPPAVRDCRTGFGFLGPAWCDAWVRSRTGGDAWAPPYRLLSAGAPEIGGAAFAATAVQRRHRVRVTALSGPYYPFRTLTVRDMAPARAGESLAATVHATSDIHLLRLGPVRSDDEAVAALIAGLRAVGWGFASRTLGEAFATDLNTVDSVRALIGNSFDKRIAYFARRMAREGEVRLEAHANLTPADWRPVFDALAAVESRSWLVPGGGDPRLCGAANRAFWDCVCATPDLATSLRVWVLHFRGEPVSYCLALDAHPVRYIVSNHYDEAVKLHSTGSIIYHAVFEDALARGVTSVDIGQGDSGYKQRWRAAHAYSLQDWVGVRLPRMLPSRLVRMVDGALGAVLAKV